MQKLTVLVAYPLGFIAIETGDEDINTLLRAEAMPNWSEVQKKVKQRKAFEEAKRHSKKE